MSPQFPTNTHLVGKGEPQPLYTVPISGKLRAFPPAVILLNPLYARNVGAVIRSCSCWGVEQLWWTGERVDLDLARGERLPREERMKGYKSVRLYRHDRPLDFFTGQSVPVAIELVRGSENLLDFEHPDNALYVFGPEDGSIPGAWRTLCHRFIQIPTRHCLNLASAVNVVLYDRLAKRVADGREQWMPPANVLGSESRGWADSQEG
jgi:tRNA(Leu) C34 or U34 (ribose-2'-O)-methylase TrmL